MKKETALKIQTELNDKINSHIQTCEDLNMTSNAIQILKIYKSHFIELCNKMLAGMKESMEKGCAANFSHNDINKKDNYVTTINPEKITNLTISVTNQDSSSVDDGANNTFISSTNPLNRIIFELEFKSRGERDDLIYEKNIYSSN